MKMRILACPYCGSNDISYNAPLLSGNNRQVCYVPLKYKNRLKDAASTNLKVEQILLDVCETCGSIVRPHIEKEDDALNVMTLDELKKKLKNIK